MRVISSQNTTSLIANLGRWVPAWVQGVTVGTARADLLAGLLGAVLALPQGVAFATLAGLPPQYGIYSAVVPCVVAALFGSSRHVVSGPTNANSLALFAMISPLAVAGSPEYVGLALGVTVLVGALQLGIGLFRLGSLANFISPSVLLGFTCGAAMLIALFALKDIFGLQLPPGTSAFGVLRFLATHVDTINWSASIVAGGTLLATLLVKRLMPRMPFMLLGLMTGFGVAFLLNHSPASWSQHVGVVGPIPSAIPPFRVPQLSWQALPDLLGLASALTIVAIGQSISIAKAVALRSGQQIDSNREIIGQGLSNIVGGFFSSYVSCGSLNRSMPNYEAGAKTPLACVFAAILLVALVSVSAAVLEQIPLAAIGAMLLLVAWSLFDVARLRQISRLSRIEFGIAIATLLATLLLRLEVAVLLGTALSLGAYLYQTSRPAVRDLLPDAESGARHFRPTDELPDTALQCPQLRLVRIEGALFFGAVPHVKQKLQKDEAPQRRHVLAMVKSMNFVDLAAAEMWDKELTDLRAAGGDLYFHRPRRQVMETWMRSGFLARLGRQNVFATKHDALQHIVPRLNPDICATCKARVFKECSGAPAPRETRQTGEASSA
ncbi:MULTISPECIES: SulP family inorganic anion transporter [Cupriavidus]|jgi:SulP family sulfate permease|uniref:SulP family inorganic anion transporter n=1 Tax=Cupriavidus TaxID=106589 RepID=UPI00164249B7|nr:MULTISPECIES: SulP family inorganic anion transporter [Cupriavidus]MCA3192133.1 SulP family inorganic anion transporter [Cupriavidus sp.]MCA3197878.1 SulP family inorganic anion transporter [Cupriavidus sp.]MCA3202931.1 SulP family inorganic anion transporter [Cupriavidus sp.]MCM3606168.1 SulP family inorganic anion transporter [Cupriavidus pauculus]MDT6961250.1 SulP family inorganic anion transporter [Cupriavidus sp. SZY C1]